MFENLGALNEADKKGGGFSPLKPGNYFLTVKEATMGETDELEWTNGVPVPTGNKTWQLTVKFDVKNQDPNEGVFNEEDVSLPEASMNVWVNSSNVGWYKKRNVAKQGRLVLAALLGVKPDADIKPAVEKPDELVGKTISCYLNVEASKTGKRNNVILNPVLKKK